MHKPRAQIAQGYTPPQSSRVPEDREQTFYLTGADGVARRYAKGEQLGKGAFGTVFQCTHIATGEALVVKEVTLMSLNLMPRGYSVFCLLSNFLLSLMATLSLSMMVEIVR